MLQFLIVPLKCAKQVLKSREYASREPTHRESPCAVRLQFAHGSILDVGDVALADLQLYLFILIQGHQEGSCGEALCELAVPALPAPAID